jgi:hypothetical protein
MKEKKRKDLNQRNAKGFAFGKATRKGMKIHCQDTNECRNHQSSSILCEGRGSRRIIVQWFLTEKQRLAKQTEKKEKNKPRIRNTWANIGVGEGNNKYLLERKAHKMPKRMRTKNMPSSFTGALKTVNPNSVGRIAIENSTMCSQSSECGKTFFKNTPMVFCEKVVRGSSEVTRNSSSIDEPVRLDTNCSFSSFDMFFLTRFPRWREQTQTSHRISSLSERNKSKQIRFIYTIHWNFLLS